MQSRSVSAVTAMVFIRSRTQLRDINSSKSGHARLVAAYSSNACKTSQNPVHHCGVESPALPDGLLAQSVAIQTEWGSAEHSSTFGEFQEHPHSVAERLQTKKHAGRIAKRSG